MFVMKYLLFVNFVMSICQNLFWGDGLYIYIT